MNRDLLDISCLTLFILYFLYALILKPLPFLPFCVPDYDLDGSIFFMIGLSPTGFAPIAGCYSDSSSLLF